MKGGVNARTYGLRVEVDRLRVPSTFERVVPLLFHPLRLLNGIRIWSRRPSSIGAGDYRQLYAPLHFPRYAHGVVHRRARRSGIRATGIVVLSLSPLFRRALLLGWHFCAALSRGIALQNQDTYFNGPISWFVDEEGVNSNGDGRGRGARGENLRRSRKLLYSDTPITRA